MITYGERLEMSPEKNTRFYLTKTAGNEPGSPKNKEAVFTPQKSTRNVSRCPERYPVMQLDLLVILPPPSPPLPAGTGG